MESLFQMWLLIHLIGLALEDMKEGLLFMPVIAELGVVGIVRCILNNLCPDVLPGSIMLLIAKFSHEQIGFGDAWLVFVLGLWIQKMILYKTLLLAFVFGTIYAGLRRKKEITFVPFLAAAYLLAGGSG